MNAKEILIKYWGYSSFQNKQEEIINNVIENKDVLAVLPTAAGKSLCYQIPTLMREGICLVISPLISLMHDQLNYLSSKGIKSVSIINSLNYNRIDEIFNKCKYGGIKFLFLSPERLNNKLVKEHLSKLNINLITVDEAHCISEWGHQFRPSYRTISKIRNIIPNASVLALTATATENVISDIRKNLNFKVNVLIKSSIERKNISFIVYNNKYKENKLLSLVNKIKSPIIIYAGTRREVARISLFLQNKKIPAVYYHAGISLDKRNKIQQEWYKNQKRIIVATNAFGMGINKKDVKLIIHMDMPINIETYFQQAGRAGRSGEKAYSVIMVNELDIKKQKKLLKLKYPEIEELKEFYQNLSNYLHIAINTLPKEKLLLDIIKFSNRYNISVIKSFNNLKYLEAEEYLELSTFTKNSSKIKLAVDTSTLYRFQIANKYYDMFVKTLLRSYPRLFQEYVEINEEEIAKKINKDIGEIKRSLIYLQKLEIIKYQHINKNHILINFIKERKDNNKLFFDEKKLNDRKKYEQVRLDNMINFCFSNDKCRNNILLEYFNEQAKEPCGKCDLCIKSFKDNDNLFINN